MDNRITTSKTRQSPLLWLLVLALFNLDVYGQSTQADEVATFSSASHDIKAYYLKETSGDANGGVIIVSDIGQPPQISGLNNTLRHVLANHHWHTLALDMSEVTDDNTSDVINDGIAFLNDKGVFNIAILGIGAGAAQAILSVSKLPEPGPEQQFEQIRALLMINAKNSIPDSDTNILQSMSNIRVPILDTYVMNDYRLQELARERKKTARSLPGRQYQQVRIPLINNANQMQENSLTKRIRGWLDSNIAGFMVDQF